MALSASLHSLAPPVVAYFPSYYRSCRSKRAKLALFRWFNTVMRLYFVLKTAGITRKTHENSLSKLWEKEGVRTIVVTVLSFSLRREATVN